MLILSQGRQDTVVCRLPDGTVIRVTVLGTTGNRVRVGYSAPLSIIIDREEVYERKRIERGEVNGNV